MSHRPATLARRSATSGILISNDVVDARLAWSGLRSADEQEVRVEWSVRLACVDAPADRELLMERFGSNGDVTLAAVAEHLEESLATGLRRFVEAEMTDRLLSGDRDVSLSQALGADARKAAFAVGLAVLPPFALRVESPSRDRERKLAAVRARLEAIHDGGGRGADPLGLLRATAQADPAWTAPRPFLWVVAGTRLLAIDPTRPGVEVGDATELPPTLGPPRSVRDATIDGVPVLLVGARDGVIAIDRESRGVLRLFSNPTGGEFGFNAACFVGRERTVVATHSQAGVVAWSWDELGAPPRVAAGSHARSVVSIEHRFAAFSIDGQLTTHGPDGAMRATGQSASSIVRIDAEHLAIVSPDGAATLLTASDLAPHGDGITVQVGSPIVAATGLDVAGVPRLIVALASGGLRMLDFAGGPAVPIGRPNLAVRSLASRPGYVVAVGVDRSRVSLIDLARPEAIASELHIAAVLGSRVADAWFG